jgi:hypothetical protein
MSSDVREIVITGNGFTEGVARLGVPRADEVSVMIEGEPQLRKIPNPMFQALAGLNPEPADRAKRSLLVGELHEVWQRCQAFYDREMEREYARLIEADEAAKEAVNAQRTVLDKLKAQLQEDAVELVRLQNAKTIAASAAQNAVMERQSLDRFTSAKQKKEADLRVTIAKRKFDEAQRKAAQHHEQMNFFQNTTLRQADRKLVELIEAELEIAARLECRDPFIAAHTAITRDSELKAQRFI